MLLEHKQLEGSLTSRFLSRLKLKANQLKEKNHMGNKAFKTSQISNRPFSTVSLSLSESFQ